MKRLDRVYNTIHPQRKTFDISSSILHGFALSDHAPVVATLSYVGFKNRPSMYRLNVKHLVDEALIEKLKNLWKKSLNSAQLDESKAEELLFKDFYESKRITTHRKNKAEARKKKKIFT